ncbi:hypothetical protein EGR_11261 [Echinococcus granulosus]|uniref:Uncharacterized protein n=1 Tax=Echinococcus granulosus TaxID=6210 RepID=W6U095_ECHGR|nr:hypothetical protein EGR_11261 [Echinococcus granulosus]EUB53886.1 hypothetical protein EGR_11261 [Echinococcus granulosus]
MANIMVIEQEKLLHYMEVAVSFTDGDEVVKAKAHLCKSRRWYHTLIHFFVFILGD